MENGKEKVVSLRFYDSIINAELEMAVLKDNNIECVINDGTMPGLYPVFDKKERGLEILIQEKDLEKAKKLLEEYRKAKVEES